MNDLTKVGDQARVYNAWVTAPTSAARIQAQDARLRRFPYPYQAMLAICSDLDDTPDCQVYLDTLKYLNTTSPTAMGEGVGLEVGNSIYFDMPSNQFSYWNTDDAGRDMVRRLIRSGHIECLHSYGDLATTRRHAERALEELARHGCRIEVWIDHGTAPSNFGGDIMRGSGDLPGAAVYHADLTCDFGVQYVWRGRVTSVIGQNGPRSLRGIWHYGHPIASAKTVAKEFVKGRLAHAGNRKYAMHGSNEVLRRVGLRSGHQVWEFLRANPHWGGVSCGETAGGLAAVLVEPMLRRLVEREGVCVLYTHLGKFKSYEQSFGARTRQALERLAQYMRNGKILVTTTRRLLGYCHAVRGIRAIHNSDGDWLKIDLRTNMRNEDLSGISFYVPEPARTRVAINGREIRDLGRNPPDHTGAASVSLRWRSLEFP